MQHEANNTHLPRGRPARLGAAAAGSSAAVAVPGIAVHPLRRSPVEGTRVALDELSGRADQTSAQGRHPPAPSHLATAAAQSSG